MSKIQISIAALAIAAAIVGAYFYPSSSVLTQFVGTSPQGSTFSSAKFYAVAVNLASPGANATSSSILNTDANDRYVSSIKLGCEGVGSSNTAFTGGGLAALTVFAATSSTAAPANNTFNANKVGGGNITVSTSTTVFAISSSTISVGSSNVYFVWPTNTYMTFTFNATNTAVCTIGVETLAS